jgi:hypothetical protein
MICVRFTDSHTGVLLGYWRGPEDQLACNTPAGAAAEVIDSVGSTASEPDAAQLLARSARAQIEALEKQQSRALREHAIGRGGTPAELRKRLEDIDDQIIALRAVLS